MSIDHSEWTTAALEMRTDYLAERHQALNQQLDQKELDWWHLAQEHLRHQPDANTAAILSSQCKRRLREQSVPGGEGWSTVQLARTLLLAQVLEHHRGAQVSFLHQLFQWGDDQEKSAIVKAFDCLDSTGRCLKLALEAGRTSNPQVFAALALDTPYPARHYPERPYNQLVLKALGMGLDASRLNGLSQRHGVTLNQLAMDLLDEQLAAGRTVSPGLSLLIAFNQLSPAQRQRLRGLDQQQRLPSEWHEHLTET
ncbi:MAG TPA: hypothetical protein DIT18_01685 [Pseudomonas sp.]|nr:hypothetical protein [Pseudomonas sp.]